MAVNMTQLTERSLLLPDSSGSNPVIATLIEHVFSVRKEAGNGLLLMQTVDAAVSSLH